MARYQVIPRTLIFVFHCEKVLLLKGSPDKKNFPNLYNGLGGHVEHGETVLAAALRELNEESGLRLKSLDLCGIVIDRTDPAIGIEVHIFKTDLDQIAEPLTTSDEGELDWFSREETLRLALVPDVQRYLDQLWSWRAGDSLYYGLIDWNSPDFIN